MILTHSFTTRAAVLLGIFIVLSGCSPRVVINTGTTIGLKATPGDGSTRPPQVTLAYKRTELALVPTGTQKATENKDALSTLASIHFFTEWFGKTKIQSILATGIAARTLQEPSGQSVFWQDFYKAKNKSAQSQR